MTFPQPKGPSMGRYYASSEYLSHESAGKSLTAAIYRTVRSARLATKHKLIRGFAPSGRLLDVGCGTGELIAFLATKGYAVEGVEPGSKASARAKQNHLLKVSPSLEDIPLQEQFQCITLWHVLEHLPDLQGSFRRLNALLAPNGYLFVAVPDRSSWDAQHYGPYWAAWDVPRHLWHFRQRDVHQLLQAHGFTLVRTNRMWLDAYYIALLSEQYRGTPKWLRWVLATLIGTLSNLCAWIQNRPSSSTLYIAQKT